MNATITGVPQLGGTNSLAAPTSFTGANYNVTIAAGSYAVSKIDGAATSGTDDVFAISFRGVSFSSAGFWLYMSENVQDNVNPALGDVEYAGPFSVTGVFTTAFTGAMTKYGDFVDHFTGLNMTFYAGRQGLTGPIPLEVNSSYQYIKVYDGGCGAPGTFSSCNLGTSVAEAHQLALVQPGIVVSPDGIPLGLPAGTPVKIYGGGFSSGNLVNITYSYSYTSWDDVTTNPVLGTLTGPVTVPTNGIFTTGATMVDTKQPYNLRAVSGTFPDVMITLWAYKPNEPVGTDIYNSVQESLNPPVFNESSRVFNQVSSYSYTGTVISIDPWGTYGNDTGYQNDLSPYGTTTSALTAQVTGKVGIVGDYQYYDGPITVGIVGFTGTLTVSPASPASNGTGYYIVNMTVPNIAIGDHTVVVTDDGVSYMFTIYVEPTLILNPIQGYTSGPVTSSTNSHGSTLVTVTAYGFPADSTIWLYWAYETWDDGYGYNVANGSTGTTGSFTGTVSFYVPDPTYGGWHDVYAVSNSSYSYPCSPYHKCAIDTIEDDEISYAAFNVLPTLVASPTTVNANPPQGTFINVWAEGLSYCTGYLVQIDHSYYSDIWGQCSDGYNGDGLVNFTASGFLPGWHQVEITQYECEDSCSESNESSPAAWTYFNVTTTGDYLSTEIHGVGASVSGFSAQLTTVQNNLATDITNAQSAITTQISTATTNIESTLAGDITSSQTAITTAITNSQTAITTAITNAQTALTTLINGVQSTATTAANEATTAANEATNANNGTGTAQTYVLVVAVLAAITLVLELAILVRKLS